MPKAGKSNDTLDTRQGSSSDTRLITNLLALLLVKGESQSEQIRMLAAAGYTSTQVASLLGLRPNAVSVALHRLRAKDK